MREKKVEGKAGRCAGNVQKSGDAVSGPTFAAHQRTGLEE